MTDGKEPNGKEPGAKEPAGKEPAEIEPNPPLADPGPRDHTEAEEDESWPELDKA